MSDTAIVGRHVDVVQTNTSIAAASPFSWGAVLGGAVAATAVSFLVISLGTGIGLLAASPYASGPSWATLTAAGAIWIVFAQIWGHAAGGYLAGRLRNRMGEGLGEGATDETNFRDGAHGFVAWAVAVLLTAAMVALGGMFAAGTTAHVTAAVGAGAASGAGSAMQGQAQAPDPSAYFADLLLRSDPTTATTGQGSGNAHPAAAEADPRAEIARMLANAARQGHLDPNDRTYLGQIVAQRTGITQADAEQRVSAAEQRLGESAKQAADKAAKAASLFSFWTFMALLMGAVAATVGGVFGGNQRDENLMGDSR